MGVYSKKEKEKGVFVFEKIYVPVPLSTFYMTVCMYMDVVDISPVTLDLL